VLGNRYVYFAADDATADQQRRRRDAHVAASRTTAMIVSNPDLAVDEAKATLLLFFSMLNEKQRRLYAGLESLKLDTEVMRMLPSCLASIRIPWHVDARNWRLENWKHGRYAPRAGGDVRRKKNARDNPDA